MSNSVVVAKERGGAMSEFRVGDPVSNRRVVSLRLGEQFCGGGIKERGGGMSEFRVGNPVSDRRVVSLRISK